MKLQPTQQKLLNKKVFGFDIETYDNNKKFLLCSIYGDHYKKTYYSPEAFISDLKHNRIFRDAILFATNLSFDFFGIFFSSEDKQHIKTLFRGSDLLFAKTFIYKNQFIAKSGKNTHSLLFLDTLNYAKIPVAKMGEIVGSPKLETPSFIGQYPKNQIEWDYMVKYNMQDSKTTYHFAKFLIQAFEDLGATVGNTLASTSMKLFTNRFLKDTYHIGKEEDMLEQFQAYYGGRTEAFERGYITDYNYYDFNSLYPSIMAQYTFPDPNTHRITKHNTRQYIDRYDGVSHVRIYVPDMMYPPLPYRNPNGRVIFPCGTLDGWYSHAEIRHAMQHGCVLQHVYKTHYFKKNCAPFTEYVNTLYKLRQKYKAENSPMEFVTKIMLNSLYGKFGQRWTNLDNWAHESVVTKKELADAGHIERSGCYIRLGNCTQKPKHFSIPIWAIYVTAYGRIKMHEAIIKTKPVYVDTDSLITKETIPESNKLGELKKEMDIAEGIIVRPKFYSLRPKDTDEFAYDTNNRYKGYVKIKGLGKRLDYMQFWSFMIRPTISYDKFCKFKEAIRRGLLPNQIISISKELSLEDQKREWSNWFNYKRQQKSKPLIIQT